MVGPWSDLLQAVTASYYFLLTQVSTSYGHSERSHTLRTSNQHLRHCACTRDTNLPSHMYCCTNSNTLVSKGHCHGFNILPLRRAPTQVRPQPRLDRVSSTPPKLWAIQAHPPAPGYLQGPTRRCRGGSCARVRRRRRPTPVAAHRPRSSERAGRAARSGQMRCGPRASAVRVGPHGPAWGARAGTERTELLRAVGTYFVQ